MTIVRPITQAGIARKLGVSQKTVSLAFGGSPSVGEELRQRILASARQLGYRHHAAAQAMVRGRFGAFGLIVGSSAHASYLPPELLDGLHTALAEGEETLLLTRIEGDAGIARLEHCLAVDGLLIDFNVTVSPEIDAAVANLRLPTVWINRELERDAVRPDDRQAGALAARLMLERGHQRMLYFDVMLGHDDQLHVSRSDRVEGCRQVLADAGLQLRLLAPTRAESETIIEHLTELLRKPGRPTAVMCYSLAEAAMILRAADRSGLRLPRDISLLTVHNVGLHLGQQLDVLAPPFTAVGTAAVTMLRQRLAKPRRHVDTLRLPFIHLAGSTLGPVTA